MGADKDYIILQKHRTMTAKQLELGQIFTPSDVAYFMVKLFVSELERGSTILDPCIGGNIFLDTLSSIASNFGFEGVEIDSELLVEDIRKSYKSPQKNLFEGDFFELPYEKKFDFAILNPPYIRQEKISNKDKIFAQLTNSQLKVSKKSNLFVYFILKTINHLNKNGKFIAIIYDSWLYSDFGISFRRILASEGCVEEIYHFREAVFPDALVGATVIVFSKKKQTQKTKYFQYQKFQNINLDAEPEHINLETFNFNRPTIHPNEDLFVPMNEICDQTITRGIGTPHNRSFYQLPSKEIESIRIIKDVKKIIGMKVESCNLEKVLHVTDFANTNQTTKNYLEEILSKLGELPNTKTLENLIHQNKKWHKLKISPPGNVLFNYYLRKKIRFISNLDFHPASNNFYQMKITENFHAQLAILNSSFTISSIEKAAKPQGNGLKKIQLNKFREVRVLDASRISETSRASLSSLGEKLVDANPKSINNIRKKIDDIVESVIKPES